MRFNGAWQSRGLVKEEQQQEREFIHGFRSQMAQIALLLIARSMIRIRQLEYCGSSNT
jgi:hypothetical protein